MAKRGRPSQLNDPAVVKLTADLFANGFSRAAMIDELAEAGIVVKDVDTITRWRRDPRVKAIVTKLIEDRTLEISRKVDSILAGRLTNAESIPTEVLLKIRKEFGGSVVARTDVDDSVTADAIKTMEENPNFAQELDDLLSGKTPLTVQEEELAEV